MVETKHQYNIPSAFTPKNLVEQELHSVWNVSSDGTCIVTDETGRRSIVTADKRSYPITPETLPSVSYSLMSTVLIHKGFLFDTQWRKHYDSVSTVVAHVNTDIQTLTEGAVPAVLERAVHIGDTKHDRVSASIVKNTDQNAESLFNQALKDRLFEYFSTRTEVPASEDLPHHVLYRYTDAKFLEFKKKPDENDSKNVYITSLGLVEQPTMKKMFGLNKAYAIAYFSDGSMRTIPLQKSYAAIYPALLEGKPVSAEEVGVKKVDGQNTISVLNSSFGEGTVNLAKVYKQQNSQISTYLALRDVPIQEELSKKVEALYQADETIQKDGSLAISANVKAEFVQPNTTQSMKPHLLLTGTDGKVLKSIAFDKPYQYEIITLLMQEPNRRILSDTLKNKRNCSTGTLEGYLIDLNTLFRGVTEFGSLRISQILIEGKLHTVLTTEPDAATLARSLIRQQAIDRLQELHADGQKVGILIEPEPDEIPDSRAFLMIQTDTNDRIIPIEKGHYQILSNLHTKRRHHAQVRTFLCRELNRSGASIDISKAKLTVEPVKMDLKLIATESTTVVLHANTAALTIEKNDTKKIIILTEEQYTYLQAARVSKAKLDSDIQQSINKLLYPHLDGILLLGYSQGMVRLMSEPPDRVSQLTIGPGLSMDLEVITEVVNRENGLGVTSKQTRTRLEKTLRQGGKLAYRYKYALTPALETILERLFTQGFVTQIALEKLHALESINQLNRYLKDNIRITKDPIVPTGEVTTYGKPASYCFNPSLFG